LLVIDDCELDCHILLADDSPDNQWLIGTLLQRW
jgi:hypothetical protein